MLFLTEQIMDYIQKNRTQFRPTIIGVETYNVTNDGDIVLTRYIGENLTQEEIDIVCWYVEMVDKYCLNEIEYEGLMDAILFCDYMSDLVQYIQTTYKTTTISNFTTMLERTLDSIDVSDLSAELMNDFICRLNCGE